MSREQIKIDYLARMEGEGALDIVLSEGQVESIRFKIWEPPRFFEAFLMGRSYTDLADMTARICGICPVAYQMSAVHAVEDAFGIPHPGGGLRQLRRLMYCGEWIESHTLHVFLLAAPDFLGYDSAIAMAANPELREVLARGLRLKRLGNDIVALLGGREIHPVGARVGGFYRLPDPRQLQILATRLEAAQEDALWAVQWAASLPLPDLTRDIEFVSLSHPDEYPMNEGRVVSTRGLDIPVEEFEEFSREEQVPYSNALQSHRRRRGAYFLGPLARVNLHFDQLQPEVQQAAGRTGIALPSSNPFTSIVARTLEVAHAVFEARRLIQSYTPPPEPAIEVWPRRGDGFALTEAPRGSLYHHYLLDEQGDVEMARIVPPTAQNQRQIEEDLWDYVPRLLSLPREEIAHHCEVAVRNYDPCISCATHLLRVNIRGA